MKTLKQLNEAAQNAKLEVQDDTINYISKAELEKYLDVAKAFLSEDSREIIKYLINHNASYISELSNDKEDNALAGFYNYGKANTDELKALKANIKNVNDSGRILEVPVFQTKEQFDAIISRTVAPDEIILDLKTEKGRNAVVKKYEPLIHKICKQFHGKSNLTYEDLLSAANEAMAWALKNYGHVRKDKTDEEADAIKGYTFGQYAAYSIRNVILDNIKNYSQTVRVPISQQQKEKEETGRNTKSNTISGDQFAGGDDDGNKTIFDFIPDDDDASTALDREDVDKLWKEIYAELEKHFDPKVMDIFYSFNGLNGHEKVAGTKLQAKYNMSGPQITYYCFSVRKYMMQNKKLADKVKEVYKLMMECQNDLDRRTNDGEPLYINGGTSNTSVDEQ